VIRLSGAVVVVTGGARGIGRATAARCAAAGARVWIGDVDDDAVAATAAELGVRGAHLDVAAADSFAAFLEQVAADGPVDMLVNNAGIMQVGPFLELPLADHTREIGVNLLGVVHGMRLVLPGMVERRRGHVVNLASMASKITTPQMATYCATKFAVAALSRAVRAELAGTGVTISTVLPAAVRTDLITGFSLGSTIPTSEADDVAAAVVATARRPRAETPVPRWLPPMGLVEQAVPEALLDRIKRTAVARALR
jgi:NAD(P)-dependent dehydrogenase (short-subunit alcohol dehydrogenase family)